MSKLDIEGVKKLIELSKTKSQTEIAKEMGISQPAVFNWIKRMKLRGFEVPSKKKMSLLDKILLNDTEIKLSNREEKEEQSQSIG